MKIRAKLISVFVILAGLGATSSFVVTNYVLRSTIIKNIGDYNVLLAGEKINIVDRIIYRRLERWESYSKSNHDLVDALNVSNQEFQGMKDADQYIVEQDKEWQAVPKNEITPFMQAIIDNNLSTNLRSVTKFYNDQYDYAIFPEVFITNKYGANVAETGKTSDYNQADEDWWQQAAGQGLYVSDIKYDESSGYYALEIGMRVDDNDGIFSGVIKVVYNIQDIFDAIDETESGLTKVFNDYLLTADGRLIYSQKDGFGGLSDRREILKPFDLGSQNRSDYYIGELDGVGKLLSHAHSDGYKDFKGLGWSMVTSRDTAEVLFPLNRIVYYNLVAIIIVMILLFLIGILLFNVVIIKPIKKLSEDVLIIKSGDLNHKISLKSKDEIGELAGSFGLLVGAVKKSQANLEGKVKDRTAELDEKVKIIEISNKDLQETQKAMVNLMEDLSIEKNNIIQEKAKAEAILRSIGDGVLVVDHDQKIIMFNAVAAQISGFSLEEVAGKVFDQVLKFVREDNEQINDKFISEAIRTGETKSMSNHTVLIKKDGSKVPVADSAAPLKDETGRVIGCVVVFRDVTKEREVDRIKSEFVSVASHQLRTPLTGIKWYTEILLHDKKHKMTAGQKEYLQQIYVSNERLVRLVDDLLDVSHIETGRKYNVVLKPESVCEIMAEVIENQTIFAKKKKMKIKLSDNEKGKLILQVDREKIKQAFGNLISNAIKYSPIGSGLAIACERKENEVIFSVKDQGLGIPADQQKRIFEKFFRADNVTTAESGTGLGLYIAKAIVEGHGGRLWFDSIENKGTTFYVALPRGGKSGDAKA
jgi:PAS domain S-box-containing protein